MTGFLQRHTWVANIVLMAAWLCGLSAIYLAFSGQVIAAVIVAVIGLGLFGPVMPVVDGGFITGPRGQHRR